MTSRFAAAALLLLAALAPAAAPAGEPQRVAVDDPVLDRNGDGWQDVIVQRRTVHYDVDFDGRFDYTLGLKFAEYTDEGHRRYLASGFDGALFSELTMEGLDTLCATDREKARWIERHHGEYPFYHDGYAFLYLFSGSDANDGRLTSPKEEGEYDFLVTFNPDGSVSTVRRGEETVKVAAFDYETNTGGGEKVFLPRIADAAGLAQVRARLEEVFAGRKGS